MNRIIFYFLLPSMLSVTSVMGAISVRANEISNTSSKNFFYHWNGFEVEWHGPGIAYVEASDWDLIGLDSLPASGRSFTQAYSGNTFAYRMTSVGNWNTQQAYSLVGTHDGSSTDTPFQTYLSGLAPGFVNRHGGNQYGFGVDNGKADIFEHRNDKIDDPGEALIVTFDLEGELSATGGSFGPESGVSFENVGLHTYARLILKDFVVRNWNRNNLIGRIDYLFYDVSEDAIIQNSVGVDAFGENININDDILFTGPWSIEHGDILVFAHPTDPAVLNPDPNDPSLDISGYTSELWGMTFDLEFDAPEPEPINYDPNNIPQHPHQPGFSNIPRTDGELIALYRTEAGNDSIRTIVQDFHRGYLLTENRGSSVGNSRILFDLTDVTSANPSVEDPEQRTLDQVLIEPMRGAMHNAYTLAPDHRVNHPGDSYVDLAGLANNTPSIMSDYPDGFQQIGGGARSAYILPYHYSATNIVDARSGQEVSSFDAHGFGGGANPIPVGNILLIAKIRSGERAIASYDISDPGNPILLDVMRDADPRWRDTAAGAYEGAVYNQYLIVPQSRLGGNISFVDYSEPGNLRMHHIIKGTAGAQRYVQFQDHRMFAGTEVIDLTHLEGGITPTEHTFPGHKGEYMLPLGNIVICAENSEQGSANLGAIYAFQAEPDVRPPSVTYHVPAAGAVDQLVTSRIGLLVHETLDTTTLNHSTFKVFPVSDLSETSIDGTIVVSDKDILTFTPMENLQYDTTYRVVAEGFTDIVGNPIERYSFDFTTASPDTLFYPSIGGISLSAGVSPLVNVPLSFFIDATPDNGQAPGTLEYKWSFGDGTETDWIDASQGFSHIYSKIGQYQVVARVRSINAPHLVAMAPPITITVLQLSAGEDGFEPRFEAELASMGDNYTTYAVVGSSNGKVIDGRGNFTVGWDFTAVFGVFDFVFSLARENRSVGVFISQLQTNEDGSTTPLNRTKIGVVRTPSNLPGYAEFSVSHYIPSSGNYRIELDDTEGAAEPNVDYLDIRMGDPNLRLEAESADGVSITAGSIRTDDPTASGGTFVDGQSGFEIAWDFYSEVGGLHDITFTGHSFGSQRSMGIFVNGLKVDVLTYETSVFEEQTFALELLAGQINTIELRDSEGTSEPGIDYLSIEVPPHVKAEQLLPSNSSQIALDGENRLIITVNPDNDTVTAVDADTLAKIWEVEALSEPRSIAIDGEGMAWITCHKSDSILVMDPSDPTNPQKTTYLFTGYGSAPHDILFNRAGTRAFVSLYGNAQVMQIDALALEEVNTVDVGPYPTALALRGNGEELLATRFISSGDSGEVYKLSVNPDTDAMSLISTLTLATDTTSEDGPNTGRGLPNYLASIVIDPADETAYIASQKVNVLAGTFRDGSTLNHDSTVRSIVSQIDLETSLENLAGLIDLNDASQPTAIAFSPDGNLMFVALQGNNSVLAIHTATGTMVFELPVGRAPQALLFDSATNRLFVKNFMSRSLTVHDLTLAVSTGDFTDTQAQEIATVASEVLDSEVLLGKQVFYNAADERMGFEGYLSCASCHQDGGHDGVTWDFTQRGEGLRNTTDLRGRSGMAHGNVHWSGNFDEIQDFELDMRNDFGGTGFIESGTANPSLGAPNSGRNAELDALAAYVASLEKDSIPASPYRQADGTLTAEGLHGKRLFEGQLTPQSGNTLSCMQCHVPGQQFTDSQIANEAFGTVNLHDVGTLKAGSGKRLNDLYGALTGIDTPTLWGLHDGAPYLHDGSAATIEAIFEQFDPGANLGEAGSAHNLGTSGYNLTATEKASLIAYLHQIDGQDLQKMDANTWSNSWGASIGDLDFDYDGDSISNRLEYLFGGNPMLKDANAQKPSIVFENGILKYKFNWRNNDPNIHYQLMHSIDLVEWGPAPYTNPGKTPLTHTVDTLEFQIGDFEREFFMLEADSEAVD